VNSTDLHGSTAVVTGASRGFGRAVAVALHQAGAHVVAVARDGERLEALRTELGDRLTPVVADAADPVVAGTILAVPAILGAQSATDPTKMLQIFSAPIKTDGGTFQVVILNDRTALRGAAWHAQTLRA